MIALMCMTIPVMGISHGIKTCAVTSYVMVVMAMVLAKIYRTKLFETFGSDGTVAEVGRVLGKVYKYVRGVYLDPLQSDEAPPGILLRPDTPALQDRNLDVYRDEIRRIIARIRDSGGVGINYHDLENGVLAVVKTLSWDDRQSTATALERGCAEYKTAMTQVFDGLAGTPRHSKTLYDAMQCLDLAVSAVRAVLACRCGILESELPSIDVTRIKIRTRGMLTVLRQNAKGIVNEHGVPAFVTLVSDPAFWETSQHTFTPREWFNLVLTRVVDVAVYTFHSTMLVVASLLAQQSLQDADVVARSVCPSLQRIVKDVQDYVYFVEHL
ncbi:hypothetical protein GGF32_002716 [Allomyces javanicus]|nr:hypothetical protein GGF32_002716 [Allomyces javanicus]